MFYHANIAEGADQLDITDFIPGMNKPEVVREVQTPEQLRDAARALALALGGKIITKPEESTPDGDTD